MRPGRPARLAALLGLAGLAGLAGLPGCAGRSQELARLRIENELLREEIDIIRRNCDRYGGVRMEAEEEEEPAEAPAP